MNTSGDAAEQVVRLSLEGVEVARQDHRQCGQGGIGAADRRPEKPGQEQGQGAAASDRHAPQRQGIDHLYRQKSGHGPFCG